MWQTLKWHQLELKAACSELGLRDIQRLLDKQTNYLTGFYFKAPHLFQEVSKISADYYQCFWYLNDLACLFLTGRSCELIGFRKKAKSHFCAKLCYCRPWHLKYLAVTTYFIWIYMKDMKFWRSGAIKRIWYQLSLLKCLFAIALYVSLCFAVLFFYDWIWPLQARRAATCLWGRTSVFYWRIKGMCPWSRINFFFILNKIIVGCKYFDFQITAKVVKIKSLLLKYDIDLKALFEISAATWSVKWICKAQSTKATTNYRTNFCLNLHFL